MGADIWVATTGALGTQGHVRLERFDSVSRRRAGAAVTVGTGFAYALRASRDSLWVMTPSAVVRVRPSAPRPSLQPRIRRGTASPRALIRGPLAAGKWRAKAFIAPFVFSTTAFAWFDGEGTAVAVQLMATGNRQAEIDVDAPRQVFADDTTVRRVGSPDELLAIFRRNRHLKVGAVRHSVIGGRRALQFNLGVDHPVKHPAVCGLDPCTLLYPTPFSTFALTAGGLTRMTLLRSNGRTILISENAESAAAFELTASLLRTFRFTA
jgi:hypothetical protein